MNKPKVISELAASSTICFHSFCPPEPLPLPEEGCHNWNDDPMRSEYFCLSWNKTTQLSATWLTFSLNERCSVLK